MRLASVLSILYLSLTATAKRTCKCMPGDSCFPSEWDWRMSLGKKLSSQEALIIGQRPIGAVCYPNDPLYDPTACQALNDSVAGWNYVYMSDQMNANNWLNLDTIVTKDGVKGCPYSPLSRTSTCEQGRVPPYVVNVATTQDIVETVKFASKYNLRLVVKNTGHEGIGRTFGVGALEIFTHNLKDLTTHNNFIPQGAPRGTKGVHAMTMGAGVDWMQAYKAAEAMNRTVVGGLAPVGTVGAAGGWQLGTGHSLVSPFYGLGVDNSLQFTVVLPDGSVRVVNEYTNPNLFWAIRGGGGPSFGIVVDVTVKTHENYGYTGAFFTGTADDEESYVKLLATWMKYHNPASDSGWGGLWPFDSTKRTLSLVFGTPGNPPNKNAIQVMAGFFDEAKSLRDQGYKVNVSLAEINEYTSFCQFVWDEMDDPTKTIGLNLTAPVPNHVQNGDASWLLPREVTAPGNATKLAEIMAKMKEVAGIPFFVGGGVVNDMSKNESSAANPAWRRAITDMTISIGGDATLDPYKDIYQKLHQELQPYRALAPPPYGGMYLNEADILEEDWQLAQWGEQYDRLRTIKQIIDPNDLLIVHMGVNSEGWDQEIICKMVEEVGIFEQMSPSVLAQKGQEHPYALLVVCLLLGWLGLSNDKTGVGKLFSGKGKGAAEQNGKSGKEGKEL